MIIPGFKSAKNSIIAFPIGTKKSANVVIISLITSHAALKNVVIAFYSRIDTTKIALDAKLKKKNLKKKYFVCD